MDLYLIAAETGFWFRGESWLAMFMVAAGLGVVIFVHELGHFLVAKSNGVKCEKFYLGFDVPFGKMIGAMLKMEKEFTIFGLPIPRTLGKFQWGETEYGIGIIPLGGYVKMLGQDDDPRNAQREAERSRIKKESTGEDGGNESTTEQADGEESFELDPRSYQAKRVPQRMAIISAGVIMNLLTAPIFATVAYKLGVKYVPCEVLVAVPGGPAWQADIRPGDQILQIGGHDNPYEHIRFGWDLRQGVGMAGVGNPLELLVRRSDGTIETITVTPKMSYYKKGKELGPAIGIAGPVDTKLDIDEPVIEDTPAGETKKPFEGGDRIIGVTVPGGTRIDIVDRDYLQLRRLLIEHADSELIFTVERTKKDAGREPQTTTKDITVGTNKLRGLGLVMKSGPIAGVRPGSPAAQAQFKKGDVIKSVAGEPFGGDGIDPMLLPSFLRAYYGQSVTFEVDRKGELLELKVTPEVPSYFTANGYAGDVMADESIGIVYPIEFIVDRVVADSPADKAGLKADDEFKIFRFLPRKDENIKEVLALNKGEPIEFDQLSQNWGFLTGRLQSHPQNPIELTFTRNGKKQKPVKLKPVEIEQYNPDRGFMFIGKSKTHTAESWGEAAALGLRETKENALRVVMFLQKLVTGGISITSLGGPATIAYVATAEATEGPSRLLLFLTFLSVNLAIVNFLPIPVLDGGHMMFLIAEGVRGKPVDEKWLTGLTLAGFFFVIGLMLFVIGLDVFRFTGWGA